MSRSIALAMTLLIPDRLPSLVLLVAFWIPPAVVGLLTADLVCRINTRVRPVLIYAVLAIFSLGYAGAWFLFQLDRMPPYVPGATHDPTYAPPQAVAGLAVVACALVFPGSVLAGMLAFRIRARMLNSTSSSRVST